MALPLDKITMKFDLDTKEAIAKVQMLKATVETIEKRVDRIAKKLNAMRRNLS